MKFYKNLVLAVAASLPLIACNTVSVAPDFIAVSGPFIRTDMKYFTGENLVGERLDSYLAPVCWLSRPAAEALEKVAALLSKQGLGLLIFDCYRPQSAVNHFVRWVAAPEDFSTKAQYYPREEKAQLFERGYIAERSGHSRGSTVDLGLYHLASGKPLDFGTQFDFMDERSATEYPMDNAEAVANRNLLVYAMGLEGFNNYSQEWWHFTFKPEPYPETYFDIPVREKP